MKKLNQFLSTLNQQANINSKDNQTNIKFYIRFVKLTENLLNGYKCFKNYTKNP